MATIGSDGNRRRILFVAGDGKRKTIRIGEMSLTQAEKFKTKIEALRAMAADLCPGWVRRTPLPV
jgi:hypothetical protein